MKKLMLIAAFICASVFTVFGAPSHETPSFNVDSTALVTFQKDTTETFDLFNTPTIYTNKGRLYDVEKIVIINPSKKNVIIVNDRGMVVAMTSKSEEFTLPGGNYWIFSDTLVRTRMREY